MVVSIATWFTRNTGRPAFHYRDCNCECHSYSRLYCFNCLRESASRPENGQSKMLQFDKQPSWRERFNKTHLTNEDVVFLTGYRPYRRGAHA